MTSTWSTAHRRTMPRLPGGLPWAGHAWAFSRDPVAFLRAAREMMGDAFRFRLLGQQVAFVCGPEAHEEVFHADESVLSPGDVYRFMKPVFGAGVGYDAGPERMSVQLSLVAPALTARRMERYAALMEEQVRAHLAEWGEEGEVDLTEAMNDITVAIASRCLVGEEFQRRMSGSLPGLFRDLEGGVRLAGLLSSALPLPAFRRRDRAREQLARAIKEVITQRRTTPGGTRHQDFLGTLMSARYPEGGPLDDETVTGLIIGLIFAGQHTSAVLAAWTGVLLLEHPSHLPGLLREQRDVFATAGPVSVDRLQQMSLLDCCVREAERMHPPLVLLMRKALRDFSCGDYDVPGGSLVMVAPGVAHRLPQVFRDPDVYDPVRFGPDRAEHRAHRYTLIGFGGGKHRCMGLSFAYQQVKVIWSVLLRTYELELVRQPVRPDYSTFIPGPDSPCLVRYRRIGAASIPGDPAGGRP